MGSTICKKMIENQGSKLLIESDGANGTTISIKWPIPTHGQGDHNE
ncbi:ATP-binding protein [Algicola sagamiensis]|nr:ATP-binding protein [Algicola sagamiensis]